MTEEPDDRLRDALGRLDPAADLPPADPARTARLVEDTMTASPTPGPEKTEVSADADDHEIGRAHV